METLEVAGKMEEKKINGYDEYEISDAVRTLRRAEEIKADKKLLKTIQPYLEKEMAAMKKVVSDIGTRDELRERASELESEGR